ncbi:MAG: response regulator [Desulfatibacillaceae bacterium]
MQTILLVDYDANLLRSLADGLSYYQDNFKILTADSGERAIVIIANQRVNLVVTEMRMPDMNGIEIIDWINMHHPSIPVIVMSDYYTPEVRRHLTELGVFQIMDKPVKYQEVGQTITKGLRRIFQGGTLGGIAVGSFLQLMEAEEKTSLVEVRNDSGTRGFMFFDHGKLIDAVCGDQQGEKAAVELLTWSNTEIRYRDVPQARIKQKISTGLMSLLMEASRLEDEGLVNRSVLDSESGAHVMGAIMGGQPDAVDPETAGQEAWQEEEEEAAEPVSDFAVDSFVEDLLPKLGDSQEIHRNGRGYEEGVPTILSTEVHASIRGSLSEIVEDIEHVYACAVLDSEGTPLALKCPEENGAGSNGISDRMASMLRAANEAFLEMELGGFEEFVMQTHEAWVLTRLLCPDYYLMIAVTRETTLGYVRLMASRYAEGIAHNLA